MIVKTKNEFQTSGGWTEERTTILRSAAAEGLSAAQIAVRLGAGCTRGAVCSKSHRIGLHLHGAPVLPKQEKRPKSTKRNRLFVVNPETGEMTDIPERNDEPSALTLEDGRHIGSAEITANQCRWPHGDPKQPGFHFCAHPQKPGYTYCPHHAARAWVPSPPRSYAAKKRISAFAVRDLVAA